MYNGILHVNTKINIIVMMKIKKKLLATINMCIKCPRNRTMNFQGKNVLNFRLTHRKPQKADLSERFGDPCREREISQGAVVSMY